MGHCSAPHSANSTLTSQYVKITTNQQPMDASQLLQLSSFAHKMVQPALRPPPAYHKLTVTKPSVVSTCSSHSSSSAASSCASSSASGAVVVHTVHATPSASCSDESSSDVRHHYSGDTSPTSTSQSSELSTPTAGDGPLYSRVIPATHRRENSGHARLRQYAEMLADDEDNADETENLFYGQQRDAAPVYDDNDFSTLAKKSRIHYLRSSAV